jgi:hypothetical protein
VFVQRRSDCRKAVPGSISAILTLALVSRIGRYLGLERIADRRRSTPSFGIEFLGVKKAVGLVHLLLENANLREVIEFRDCGNASVQPGHIKRQSDLNARS